MPHYYSLLRSKKRGFFPLVCSGTRATVRKRTNWWMEILSRLWLSMWRGNEL